MKPIASHHWLTTILLTLGIFLMLLGAFMEPMFNKTLLMLLGTSILIITADLYHDLSISKRHQYTHTERNVLCGMLLLGSAALLPASKYLCFPSKTNTNEPITEPITGTNKPIIEQKEDEKLLQCTLVAEDMEFKEVTVRLQNTVAKSAKLRCTIIGHQEKKLVTFDIHVIVYSTRLSSVILNWIQFPRGTVTITCPFVFEVWNKNGTVMYQKEMKVNHTQQHSVVDITEEFFQNATTLHIAKTTKSQCTYTNSDSEHDM